ncbi:DNA-binding HxlR family transcriptional regulator [Ancylobacter sp. 3268]|uniref:winged helix-turn-helix transcriptional regulator n=1 Tax=Ancylobacter sp. 3268 TaxID=2817752 RepID=UPI0028652052|nr:helix-turn-helix domain-containing protein [Ancylobacter sp. 3268]MDR6950868.1 DNA-binding HxlR family transcriptional regulator [Ancylobacter sp. 3268]
MERKSFGHMQCPIARSLEHVGEWWSILILRDAFYGLSRFDEFQASLGVATNTLSRRLAALVEAGLLEKRPYMQRPPRYEYVLTDRGRDFRPVLLSLLAWGNRQFATEGRSVELIDRESGEAVEPILCDRATGRPIAEMRVRAVPGPAADERLRRRLSDPPVL